MEIGTILSPHRLAALVAMLALGGCPAPSSPPAVAPFPAPCPSIAPAPIAPAPIASAPIAPAPAPSAEPAWREPTHESFMLTSRGLGESRRINLYTPPGYTDSSARFTALYLLDGGDEEDFPHPHVLATIDEAIRAGEMRPLVVVGIENTERRRDMTGPTHVESDTKIATHVGGSSAFRAFLRDELMPEVNRRVRTSGKNAIVGESLAGLFVAETFFLEPTLFDTYIAISPSLWWNDLALARGAEAWMKAHPKFTSTLYVTHGGDDDRGDAITMLGAALRTGAPRGLMWSYEPRSDLRHANIYETVAPAVLRKLLPAK